jgi:two-component system chemotaxis response regulator CheY
MCTEKTRPRVLIVDDAPEIRLIIRAIVKRLDCGDIEECATGAEAWFRLNSPGPAFDLVITDYNMPDMDGLELITRCKSMPTLGSIPMLMVSAQRKVKGQAFESGAVSFVEKPFDVLVLGQRIAEILGLNPSILHG